MKIIILGAGQVGGTLAENLVGENNDITVVDTDSGRLRQLQDKFDLRVVQGHGSHPRVLREAGAEDADMLVAVTNSDETNMIACQIAYSLFNTPNRIARIRAPEYIRESEKLFLPEAVPIDHLISPEQLVIDYIYKLIEYPGALQVVNFAEGKVSIAAVKAYYGGPLVGNALSSMREHMPHIDTRVAAIFRQDRPIRPQGSTIIEAGDEVFFVAASQHIRAVMSELQRLEKPYKRIMIVGGGFETMYAEEGIGLAATQVDIHQRIIVIDVSESRDQRLVLINPELLEKSGETGIEEGCLSIPEQRALVPRAAQVKIRALDREGKPFELEADDLLAICIQHEMDHLMGKLFVDYLSPLKRQRIRQKLEKMAKLQARA